MNGNDDQFSRTPRRRFLKQTAGLAAGAAMLQQIAPSPFAAEKQSVKEPLLPTIKLGKHDVTRLIIGNNPIYGFSHFNKLFSEHQKAWHTPERVVELLKHCESKGINTWQIGYHERSASDLARYRDAGGKLNWLCLSKPDWDQKPELFEVAAKQKPMGIAPHGALAERLHREKKISALTDLLKRIRQLGVLVGLSAHNPELIDLAEQNHWDVDYYMCCLYYLTRPRDEFQKILGADLPLGEIYLPSDPPRAFKTIQQTRKPCLVYKILAAGRKVSTPSEVRRSFETSFANIKPSDAVIVGMYQQFGDQVAENAATVRAICTKQA
jgi:hypothetical protein